MIAELHVPPARVLPREVSLPLLLEGVVALNRVLIPLCGIPSLYDAGVRYQLERGTERWYDALTTWEHGYGDCDQLAAWRVAELQLAGVDAVVAVERTGPRTLHALVELPDGSLEDPSRILGMGQRRRRA